MKTRRRDLIEAVPRREIDIFDEMDRMFDTMFHRGWLRPFREIWPEWHRFGETFDLGTPRVDVIDRDEEILVRAEVPGVEKKEEGELVRAEIARGTFSRTIHLPEDLELDKAKADFKDGLLEIHLPKTPKTERRHIEVS